MRGTRPGDVFLTALAIDFLRFEVHFSCSVWDLRRDSISAHVWYGLRTNLGQAVTFTLAHFRLWLGSNVHSAFTNSILLVKQEATAFQTDLGKKRL